MWKLRLRKTDLFIVFGNRSGKSLQSLSLQSWLWPPAEWLSSQASSPDSSHRLPGSPARVWGRRDGTGLRGGTCFKYQTELSASAMCRVKTKTKLSQQADVFPGLILLISKNVFWYEIKISRTVGAKSDGSRCDAVGASRPHLGASTPLCSTHPSCCLCTRLTF